MIGTNENRNLVDWQKTTIDGETVYELEYDAPISAPTSQRPTLFGASSGGMVPASERTIQLPDGEKIPATEAVYEAEGTTLRIRRESPSVIRRLRRYLPW